jgi:hypothetical protein
VAYRQDYANSARRHREAADALSERKACKAVAGYLYGVAAECALKELMRRSGMRPRREESSAELRDDKPRNKAPVAKEDPFYLHFPRLKTALRDCANGRKHDVLLKFTKTEIMREWDTDMRYAPSADITEDLIARWKEDALAILRKMEES